MLADLHLHTTCSDGTLSPTELIKYANERGIDILAITDHDTVRGIKEARCALRESMQLISGVEFSCIYDGKTPFLLHILGYGIDADSESIRRVVEIGRQTRLCKHSARLKYLGTRFDIHFTDEERKQLDSNPSVGKLHIANLLVERALARDVRDAIDKYMSSPDFPDGRISYKEAIGGIINSGGIPVYAHPLGGEGEAHLKKDEAQRRIKLMRDAGIIGVECYYSRYSADEITTLTDIAGELGMRISGGSDFHGKNKTVDIGCLSADGEKITADKLSVLDELCL